MPRATTQRRSTFQPLNRSTLPQYRARLNAIRPEAVPNWGCMDPAELFQHLRKYVELTLDDSTSRTPLPQPLRWLAKKMFLSALPFPRSVATFDELRPVEPDAVEEERTKLLTALDELTSEIERQPTRTTPHPFFGPLTMQEWSVLNGKHLQHHLVQFGV